MVIALDTNVIIHLMRRHPIVRMNFGAARAAETPMSVSAVVMEEITYGFVRHAQSSRERAYFDEIVAGLAFVPFEPADAEFGGRVRAEMALAGKPPPYSDFLIGAHALARGHTLVTANTRDFQNIPGLQLLDWTQPPDPEQD